MNLGKNWLNQRAVSNPQDVAIYFEESAITFLELFDQVKKYANGLLEISTGDKVALHLDNSPEMIALIHACQFVGKKAVLINTRLTASEVEWQLRHLNVGVLISNSDLSFTDLDLVIYQTTDQIFDHSTQEPPQSFDPSDIAWYVFTSGTTGLPKAVPLTYSNMSASAIASQSKLGAHPGDIWLLNMPLFHLGGLAIVFRSIISNIAILLHSRFDMNLIIGDLQEYPITLMSLVPTMLKRLMPHLNNKSTLRHILIGGAATPVDLQKEALQTLPIAITYGMTETCSQFTTAVSAELEGRIGTSGKPISGEFKIFDYDSSGIGEIGVKGPTITPGYVVSSTTLRDGYFMTGDLGYEIDGYLYVVQRRQDLIISGGENIYPSEVEAALNKIPGINASCVFGITDSEWGQIPVACLELQYDIAVIEIIDIISSELAPYKIPKAWYRVDMLPRTASGKIIRKDILNLYPEDLNPL
ncbi:MAG: o-succinylbenzoate--CoA ligase [Candidatus Kariarchaeaceae archaeon]|jgi:O-succinylbenzoic acid--CoA ligase